MRRDQEFSPHQTQPLPSDSKIDWLLSKDKPTRDTGGAPAITYSRKGKKLCSSCEKVECVSVGETAPSDTKASEGEEMLQVGKNKDSSAALGEDHSNINCPSAAHEGSDGADIHPPEACVGLHTGAGGYILK